MNQPFFTSLACYTFQRVCAQKPTALEVSPLWCHWGHWYLTNPLDWFCLVFCLPPPSYVWKFRESLSFSRKLKNPAGSCDEALPPCTIVDILSLGELHHGAAEGDEDDAPSASVLAEVSVFVTWLSLCSLREPRSCRTSGWWKRPETEQTREADEDDWKPAVVI